MDRAASPWLRDPPVRTDSSFTETSVGRPHRLASDVV